MIFALRNHSTDPRLTAPVLQQIADALQAQANEDVSPEHGGGYVVRYEPDASVKLPDGELELGIFPTTDVAGALGYHTVDARGKPYGKCFLDLVDGIGLQGDTGMYLLTVTLSHEMIEMIGDPGANRNADRTDGTEEAFELCDRVEDMRYLKHGVWVSNFLLQAAFSPFSAGPYSFMDIGLPSSSWALQTYDAQTPGGYCIRRQIGAEVTQGAAHLASFTAKRTVHITASLEKISDETWRKRMAFPGSRAAQRGVEIKVAA